MRSVGPVGDIFWKTPVLFILVEGWGTHVPPETTYGGSFVGERNACIHGHRHILYNLYIMSTIYTI